MKAGGRLDYHGEVGRKEARVVVLLRVVEAGGDASGEGGGRALGW